MAYLYRIHRTDETLVLWIVAAVWSTGFAYHYDIRYDWAMSGNDEKHPILRKNRIM